MRMFGAYPITNWELDFFPGIPCRFENWVATQSSVYNADQLNDYGPSSIIPMRCLMLKPDMTVINSPSGVYSFIAASPLGNLGFLSVK